MSESRVREEASYQAMKGIKVFVKPGTPSPLSNKTLRLEHGVEVVAQPEQADWIMACRVKSLIPYFLRHPGKRYLVYATEPRLSRSTSKQFRPAPLLPKIELMTVFTGDVFWHNFHFLGSYHSDIEQNLDLDLHQSLRPLSREDLASVDKRPVAALFTYRITSNTAYIVDGTDRDLELTRCSHATALYQAGLCDIYGSNWPRGMSKEDSGFTSMPDAIVPWWTRKLSLLSGYRYNLCLENTAADYYCTEKIWHAIQAGTLPIYWGANTTIYDIFPRNSFIDLADFDSPESLIEYLHQLPEDEYLGRINRCREVFNRCITERRNTLADDPGLHMEKLLKRLRS